jgi:uncharacterized protein YbaA (DUF1428 family)
MRPARMAQSAGAIAWSKKRKDMPKMKDMPFDGNRMIIGGFVSFLEL